MKRRGDCQDAVELWHTSAMPKLLSFTRSKQASLTVAAFLLALSPIVGFAQTDVPPPQTAQTGPVESAVLLLTFARRPVPLQPVEKFDIRVDAGKAFQPTGVRLEGDDPLNIAFLIDDSRDPFKTLGEYGPALAALVPKELHPADHVTIYALDCTVARTMQNAPADPEALKTAVANALGYGKLHGTGTKPACGSSVRLWDFAAVAIEGLAKSPGRRVLVIISGGNDKGSKNDWMAVKASALSHSVAIFGLRDQALYDADSYTTKFSTGSKIGTGTSNQVQEAQSISQSASRPFDQLCGTTGGMVINITPGDMGDRLNEVVGDLRTRQILQFPDGSYVPDGSHTFKISVKDKGWFASGAGANMVVPPAATP